MNDDNTITIDRQSFAKSLDGAAKVLLTFTPLVVAFTFSPVTVDNFDLPKGIVMFVISGLLLLVYLIKSFLNNKLDLVSSVFNLPVFLFAFSTLLSSLVPVNKLLGLSDFALSFLPFIVVYLATSNLVNSEDKLSSALTGLGLGVLGLGVFNIASNLYTVLARVMQGLPTIAYLNPVFSPSGSIFAQGILYLIVLPVIVSQVKESKNKVFWSVVLGIVTISGLLTLNTLYSNRPALLDYQTSWKVATGALGASLMSALFGSGLNQYVNAFSMYKPLEFNLTPFWNLKFATAGNYYLTLLTTGGVAALASFVYLTSKFVKVFRLRMSLNVARPTEVGLLVSMAVAFALYVIFPASNLSLFILFMSLGLLTAYYRLREVSAVSTVSRNNLVNSRFAPVATLALFGLIFAVLTYYFIGRVFAADLTFANSLKAANSNRGAETYNLQIKAIALMPFNDNYHVTYSQTNLALADSIAGTATPGGGLTEAQRNNVVQLVQQSIREARIATAMDPLKASNWENLAVIYKSLINFAQGADQWSVVSQNQAITLDPTNPRLRLDLGGLFVGFGQYNTAAQYFSLAAQLKPDYANAYYNLAQAYKLLKNNDFYKQNMDAARSIVCQVSQTSADCKKIAQELADFDETTQTITELNKQEEETNLATASARPTNLPRVKPTPPPTISSPSGELKQP